MRQTLRVAAASLVVASSAPGIGSDGGAGGGVALVPMDEIIVPIVDGARAGGRLRVKLVLEAHDAGAAARITAALPAWRETSVIAAAEFARLYASPMSPVDAQRLARDIATALRAQDKDHSITRVLLVEVAAVRA